MRLRAVGDLLVCRLWGGDWRVWFRGNYVNKAYKKAITSTRITKIGHMLMLYNDSGHPGEGMP